jgi:phage shock protein PspC (stress-responsive transcriptional regulator)
MSEQKTPKKLIGGVLSSISVKYKLPVLLLRIVLIALSIFFPPLLVLYAVLWFIQLSRIVEAEEDMRRFADLNDPGKAAILRNAYRLMNGINSLLCLCLILASGGFFLATAMSFANGNNEMAKTIGLLLTMGIPIVTMVSMVTFWRFEENTKSIWLKASLAPWLYTIGYLLFVGLFMF